MNADRIAEWVYQLERVAPKVYAKQHMAVVEVIEFLKTQIGSGTDSPQEHADTPRRSEAQKKNSQPD